MKISSFALFGITNATAIFPAPSNATYGTDIKAIELIDWNRTDPYDPNGGPRKLMVSAIWPTMPIEQCRSNATYPYAPPKTVTALNELSVIYGFPNGSDLFSNLSLTVCPDDHHRGWPLDQKSSETFPVVLFSHGSGASRLLNTAQAQSVAAQGFIVLTIDHPYNAYIVEYLDGSIINGISSSYDTLPHLDREVRIRSKDASFVVDQIRNPQSHLRKSVPQLHSDEKVGMYGWSLGGTASARTAYDDKRILGALNLDGYPYGWKSTGNDSTPQFTLPQNMTTPFLLFDADSRAELYGYANMYEAFSGWKEQLSLVNSTHYTFSDLPLIVDLQGHRSAKVSEFIGSINGHRARDAQAAYIAAFMGLVLKDEQSPLLQGPSVAWPEVSILRQG